MAARKKDTDNVEEPAVEAGPGYHGEAATDRGHVHRPEDVGTFVDHIGLDKGVTVHHGDGGATGVTSETPAE